MQNAPFDYRHRYLIHTVVYVLGFLAPWDYALHLDHFHTTWEWSATHLAAWGILQAGTAFQLLLVKATVLAALGAWLRTWGAAYLVASLGAGVVQDHNMHGSAVVAAGPYRYMRNPLYLGTLLHTLGLALLMPPTGALFAILIIGFFQFRLIAVEEPFLTAQLGQPYVDYAARVPRFLPALTPRVGASGATPRWPQAMLGEIYMIAVAVAFAAFGWQYNALLLIKCVVIALGVSLVARAFAPRR